MQNKNDSKMFSVRMPISDHKKLDDLAKQAKRSRGDVIRILINDAVIVPAPDIATKRCLEAKNN